MLQKRKKIKAKKLYKACKAVRLLDKDEEKQHMEVVEWSARLARKRAFRARRLLAPSSMMHVLL